MIINLFKDEVQFKGESLINKGNGGWYAAKIMEVTCE